MKVFISWSGSKSKKYAEVLRNWLPAVLQLVKPYFTPSDVEKGTRWNTDIAKELESSEIGILCVTRDNLHSEWVMFEAGALSKSMDKTYVCPVLFGIQNTDLAGPLKQFQTTEFDKDDFKRLVNVINNKLEANKLSGKVLDSVFEKWWPELELKIQRELSSEKNEDEEPIRSERELLEEILELSRTTVKNSSNMRAFIHPAAIKELLNSYISLHDDQVNGQGGYQDTLNGPKSMTKSILYLAKRVEGTDQEVDDLIEKIGELSFEHVDKRKPDFNEDDFIEDDIPF